MPDINVKSFNELVETLEKMADGVKKHGSQEGFPNAIKEENLRALRKELEDLRSEYEQTLTSARMLQDKYRERERTVEQIVAGNKSMLYGFFGKKNQIVSDFGMKPFKDNTRSKKNNSAAKKPAGS